VPSIGDFIVLAAARALREHPGLNASAQPDGIHLRREINVGVAVAVPNGLLVPVVTGAADRSLVDLATEIKSLAGAARAGKLTLSQLEGGTFVVTSLGGYGVDFFTPIVNPGHVAILGVGRLRDGVRWEGETPRRTQVLTLSLTFDHRAVDGAPAAEYLQTVEALLAQPLRLLAG
jgi:pyruvate dehydrogenase E2 component (dihydrolipoamide acetyltransferase)